MEYMAIYTNRWKYSTVWESMISWSFNLGFNGDIMGTLRNGAKYIIQQFWATLGISNSPNNHRMQLL